MSQKCLILGNGDVSSYKFMTDIVGDFVFMSDQISLDYCNDNKFDWLISYGYRYIVTPDILDYFKGNAINLHISYLPWNRGADPNLWSIIDNTPKGVTIHYMDEKLDTGDIIAQEEVYFDSDTDTLATSYDKLKVAMEGLFLRSWDAIKNGTAIRKKQEGNGSYHSVADKAKVQQLINGWDTKISVIKGVNHGNI